MKKTLFLAAIAALFTIASCQKAEVRTKDKNGDLVFTATIAGQCSKTTIDAANGKVSWVIGDEITIKDAASTSVKYTVSSIDAQGKATFTKKSGESGSLGDGPYTAVYGTDPATSQTYSADAPALPMSAESTTTSLNFTVSCGLLELSLTAGESITSIDVTGTPTGGSETTYSLTCTEPVSILNGAKFFIAVPAGSYTSFLLKGENGAQCKKEKSGTSIDISANQIQPISLTDLHFAVQLWADGPYWATTNIGATSPTDYGQFFAWGYTEGCVRNSANDSWVLASDASKDKTFDDDETTGFSDIQEHVYSDMAVANWGAEWSMPTDAQFNTLISNCSISFVTTGTKGIKFTGKESYTSNSIFLPAAGLGEGRNHSDHMSPNEKYFYWSSTQVAASFAYRLCFDSNPLLPEVGPIHKYRGHPVRPVRSSL